MRIKYRGIAYKRPLYFLERQNELKIAGITAEYNPLHSGHIYHMEETRRLTGCDALVVAMSGDFVQRGEPAILDKWLRAEHALKAGADLVVEIPTLFCLGNASQYARGSVGILEALGCGLISFGSESGDIGNISDVAAVLKAEREAIESHISAMIREGKSYPAARSEAYKVIRSGKVSADKLEKELSVLSDPNDILALEYIINMKKAVPFAIKREGSYHDTGALEHSGFTSAERIRSLIKGGSVEEMGLDNNVPSYVADSFRAFPPVFPDDCFELLKYAILSESAESIDECPSGGEGLGNLLKSAVNEACDYDGLIMRVKSKRYTYTRISRLCMQILLHIKRSEIGSAGPGYIRVLGHNERGREVLAAIRKASKDEENSLCAPPVITNINKEMDKLGSAALSQLKLDIHASEIYDLISPEGSEQHVEQRMKPVMA